MNEYDALLKYRQDTARGEQRWQRNEQFVEELAEHEQPQPKKRRFNLHLPNFSGLFHRHQQPVRPCRETPA